MNIGSLKLDFALWAVFCLFLVFTHELTVRDSELKLCVENEQECVTDLRDCGPPPPTSTLEVLNMSCYYEMSESSVTCDWSHESSMNTHTSCSLIFSSSSKILYCQAIFNPAAILNVTARIKNYKTGREIWSQPHTVFLYSAVKPSPPVLSVLRSTVDTVVVSWKSSIDGTCRLCCGNSTHVLSQVVSVPVHRGQTLVHTIKHLLPFSLCRAAVACRGQSGRWSDWSSEIAERTLERAPSKPPEMCYRVEKPKSGGTFHLHLMWKALDLHEAGGRVLGYQVSYEPMKKQRQELRLVQNVTEPTALLEVEDGYCSVTVKAFNMAGYGPAAHLSIDTNTQNTLPSVKHLWISSSLPGERGLLVQWEIPADPGHPANQLAPPTASPPTLPISYFAIQWRTEMHPFISHWTRVDGFTASTVIREHLEPDQSYTISVFPVYSQHCGSSLSLPASLQHGALLEAVQLKVIGVTKSTITAVWAWQRKSGPIRVNRYEVMLREDSEKQTQQLWPDQWQHTFLNLKPNTDYSLILLADNVSRDIIPIRTPLDEVTAAATATLLLLLVATVLVISILSTTVFKSYFFPPISSPRGSMSGQWLMDISHQKPAERSILDLEDFQVTDVLGGKSRIEVRPKSQPSSDENLHENTSLSLLSQITIKPSVLELDTEYVSEPQGGTQQQEFSLQSYHPDYVVKCDRPDSAAFISEKTQHVPLLLCQTDEAGSCFPQKEEGISQFGVFHMLGQAEVVANDHFHEIMASKGSFCICQMDCMEEYVVNSSFLEKTDETANGQADCSYLLCQTDYVAVTTDTQQVNGTET
ncbi:hypothetical protein LDENG_00015340 [Lucifuga dentata]|nr:hypothetical protein LDENG_00015340 [Lucifuga dentata]